MKKIAIVIPACNEEAEISACLNAIQHSIDHLYLNTEDTEIEVKTFVVLDSCHDQTMTIAAAYHVELLCCEFR